MLGIIGAMEVEVESLKEMMENQEITKIAGMEFYKGEICGKEVVVVRSGIGKVNAAICTQVLIDAFQVEAVINTGVAGSLNPEIHICDIVVSTEAMEHDMDVSPLGYEKGVIPDMKTSCYPADPNLRILAKSSIKAAGLDVAVFDGKVVSGDQFIATPEKKDMLSKVFGGDFFSRIFFNEMIHRKIFIAFIDRYMNYDEFLEDKRVKELKTEMYS